MNIFLFSAIADPSFAFQLPLHSCSGLCSDHSTDAGCGDPQHESSCDRRWLFQSHGAHRWWVVWRRVVWRPGNGATCKCSCCRHVVPNNKKSLW